MNNNTIIVHSNYYARLGLCILSEECQLSVWNAYSTFHELSAVKDIPYIDLLIIDSLPWTAENKDTIGILRKYSPTLKILVLGQQLPVALYPDLNFIDQLYQPANASLSVLKNIIASLVRARRSSDTVLPAYKAWQDRRASSLLSPMELFVFHSIISGKNACSIMSETGFDAKALSACKRRIMRKLNVTRMVDLLTLARGCGLL
ncbi:hypothetical protein J0B02_07310 [Enterobacteriaceae bacterium YMB-R22]|jgi:DNA-binding NarL/FixJ family response regulator|uniref:hypothetical protein n=1 Tax=Tenebrionicola larvae TaxID=2815733 RepID=UPI002012597B|nr:hypothetical protein [Tenebrionicola larvae]MBV4412633.1 hypothetical protein [Tenebrionicola larvae]